MPTLLKPVSAWLYRYSIPLKGTLRLKHQIITFRRGYILRLAAKDGSEGFGELAPLPGFSKETLTQAKQALLGSLTEHLAGVENTSTLPSVAFCLDCARWQIPTEMPAQTNCQPLLQDSSEEINHRYLALNKPNLVKLKVAKLAPEVEAALINRLVSLNPKLKIRLDANQSWSLEQALNFARQIPQGNVDYIEEPCQQLSDSLNFATQTGIALGLDESLQVTDFELPHHPLIKALILKPTLIGSLKRLRQLIQQANRRNIQVSISSSFESSMAISQLYQLAEIWTPETISGLDTLDWFSKDIICPSGRNIPCLSLNELELVWKSSTAP